MSQEISFVTYEQLAAIEDEFDAVDLEIMRQQYILSKPLYAKRAKAVAKLPHFWALVLEQSGPEIDSFITPDDSRVFGENLIDLSVTRPELDSDSQNGHPRSFTIKFTFAKNDYFEDTSLEKKFSYRRSKDGWTGLVSEPVKIHWKKDKDLTEGLTDLAVALFEARKKANDMKSKTLSEYAALQKKVESWNTSNTSFFTWFGFVSDFRFVSAEESDEANKKYAAKREEQTKRYAAAEAGGDEEDADDDEDDDDDEEGLEDDSEVEVCENGEDLAIAIAEDLWPNAIKFLTSAQEMDDMSDIDFEEMDEDDDDDDEEKEATDMRAIVGNGEGPPAKKARK